MTKTNQESRTSVERESLDRVEVLGVPVQLVDRASLTGALRSMSDGRKPQWISYANVHAVNLAQDLPWFRQFLRDSLITYCDGEGLRLGSRIIGKQLPERIALTDWVFDILGAAEQLGWRVFILGSTDVILQKTLDRIRTMNPQLQVAGVHHGYFSPAENNRIVSLINAQRPDLLFVAMGMPRQEQWIVENHQSLDVRLILNAGSCFDYLSGEKRRCPKWMGNIGMEWLYRLIQEPRRLWKRYLIGNPLFLLRVLRQRFTM